MDFLSALLDRAAPQPRNVLQRRPSSRFEPSPELAHHQRASAGLDDAGVQAVPTISQPAAASQAPLPMAQARHGVLRSGDDGQMGQTKPPGQDTQDRQTADLEAAGFKAWPPARAAIPAVAEPATEHQAPHGEFARLAATLAALQSRSPQHDLLSTGVAADRPTESTSPRWAQGSDETFPGSQRAAGSARADAQGLVRPAAKASDPSARPVPAVATRHSALQPSLAPLPHPAASTVARRMIASAAPLPPTVHVSIGRIDIRAVGAGSAGPKASRSAQASGPTLSLDDYLKSRNGGQR